MEQTSPRIDRLYTEDEYLRMEAASDVKHEFHNGRVIAMAGGGYDHSLIKSNLGGESRASLKGRGCEVVDSDTRVGVARTRSHYYPDLSVVCGGPQFDPPDRRVTLLDPQVIVEVLSPSTAATDVGVKLEDYTAIEALQEYMLIAQDRPRARSFRRGAEGVGRSARGSKGWTRCLRSDRSGSASR